ncbi:MAG TPA: DUF5362 family protein [Bacteroidales bacterium]|nr:DUF5362 family protein [Bacteroidales bacterium]HOX75179.1 DUF5362 family protein [Bacteroidales bacterium]HPM88841.1 DUF5362 family protein [Bacteroidales bacterium]HQM70209.1 DUF5362 family protein [Bacteroidales bacterium]
MKKMNGSDDRKIEIGSETIRDLDITRKWTMFLSVIGFIGTAAFLISGLFTGIFLSVFDTSREGSGIPGWISFIAIILITLLILFPVIYLFRFSKFAATAVKTGDGLKLKTAFRNLKRYYVFSGILVIIALVAYLLVIISTFSSMAFVKGLG